MSKSLNPAIIKQSSSLPETYQKKSLEQKESSDTSNLEQKDLALKSSTYSKEIESLEQENERFLTEARLGGNLAKQGIATEFVQNPILKNAEKTVNNSTSVDPSTSFTRNANIIEINTSLLASSSSEEKDLMNALTNHKIDLISRFRRKHVDYGNYNAMHEVVSQKIFALTGMFSPDTKIMVHESEKRENGELEISVISPMITGYKDLGDFLIDNAAKRFIDEKNHDLWIEKKTAIEEINEKTTITDKDKLKRINLMSEIYEMLPNYFHNEIEKAFAASKFIGNWDFANFNLNNIGCQFELNHEGDIVSFKSAFVDFGNSGVIGFGGKHKELSLDRANTEAKSQEKKPQDYDPALKLTKDEERLVTYKMKKDAEKIIDSDKSLKNRLEELAKKNLSKEDLEEKESNTNSTQRIKDEMLRICFYENPTSEEKKLQNQLRNKAINNLYLSLIEAQELEIKDESNFALRNEKLIRSIIFKEAHHIREEEASLIIDPTTIGLLTISDLPRNLPFASLFKNVISQKNKAVAESESSKYYCDSEIEMAFRLSLITDKAISYISNKWDFSKKYPQIFATQNELENKENFQGEALANIFKQRKEVLANSIPQEIINNWIAKNGAKAISAEESVRLSVLEQTDGLCDIVEENSVKRRITQNIDNPEPKNSINNIKLEIEAQKEKIKEENQEIKQIKINIEDKQKLIEENQNSIELLVNIPNESIKRNFKETFTNNIKSFESDIQNYSKDLEEKTEKLTNDKILEFIDKNSKKWNLKVFDSDPSYNLFDLRGIRRIEEIKNINEKEGKLSLKNSESESPLTSSESSFDRKQRKSPNQIDEDINSEILKEFMNLLEKISDFTEKSQNPASVINNNRLDNVTHLYKNESNKDGINL